jgi:hypothetical protein
VAPYRLLDGTPAFHAVGELLVDGDEGLVCCGLCGRWFRALPSHLHAHGWTADEYRAAFGLNAQRPLQAPAVSRAQSGRLKRRIETDERVQAGMRKGLAMARSGELNELGRLADAERGRALERRRRTLAQGSRLDRARAERFREERERRARALGYAGVEDLLRRRYLEQSGLVAELAEALGCAEITVVAEMERLGIPRRAQQQRLSEGRRALATKWADLRAQREARVRALGFADLGSYLRTRHHGQRWPRGLIAAELGVTVAVVARLMRNEGVPVLRGLTVAKADR